MGSQCCTGLVCEGGVCGQPLDAGMCSLDPGGTPCSQCIVFDCCDQTEACLDDATCSQSFSCFQNCIVGGGTAPSCQMQCCMEQLCNTWATCFTQNCEAACTP
jgi:hypothetical protein